MAQERLSSLTCISIEKRILNDLDKKELHDKIRPSTSPWASPLYMATKDNQPLAFFSRQLKPVEQRSGFTYILTCIDRFSRWPEAIPLVDITTESVIRALISGWITRFGASRITSDRGRQFEAPFFREFSRLLGVQRIHTTSYQSASNKMVERLHRQLKAALRATPNPQRWIEFLPIVLLDCWSAVKADLGYSSAEYLYGTTLALPGQMLVPIDSPHPDPASYITRLRSYFSDLPPMAPRDQSISSVVPADISTWTHVLFFGGFFAEWCRERTPYTTLLRPFPCDSHAPKLFTVGINGRKEIISIDRVKKAFSENLIPLLDTPVTLTPPPTTSLSISNILTGFQTTFASIAFNSTLCCTKLQNGNSAT
ncbi:uncharacterized protein LOC115213981 [Octopus sinensis]|uniref:Uncharacterized protein LOC115213981 n=1 Tax=Octopus sinensis TaxID=2607531 RepID=A0A6P7SKN7_9MOLL|nr:uncharacterized protein LOC115213981 [Octopus sinensis]